MPDQDTPEKNIGPLTSKHIYFVIKSPLFTNQNTYTLETVVTLFPTDDYRLNLKDNDSASSLSSTRICSK